MADGHISADYGWRDAEPTCAHTYLEPVVLQSLQCLGVRRVLDLGCGNGALCRTLKDAGFDVAGCDADRAGVELARGRNPDIRFEVMDMAGAPGPFAGEIFDAVVSTEVVEHLYSPQRLPQAVGLLLKEGGWLVVTTPYHGYVKNLVLSLSNPKFL